MCPGQEAFSRLFETGVISAGYYRSGNEDDVPSRSERHCPQDFTEATFYPVPDYGVANPLAY